MAAHILKLGTLDLSSYLRVGQEDGMDPLDSSGFLDPQFSDSVLSEGQPLISVTQGNREMDFPLYLRSTTMDALADLMQSIKSEIDTTRPLRIEWRDQGATNSTFYDVTFARFDPDYNYRRAGNGGAKWMGGHLRVFCAPPYGHTGTTRIVATGVASGSALRIPIPSAIDGDVNAQLKVQIGHARAQQWDGDQVVVSVLPNPSWNPIISASQFLSPLLGAIGPLTGASIGIASGAPGANLAYGFRVDPAWYSNVNPTQDDYADRLFGFALPASIYTGNIRVLAAVKAPFFPGMNLKITNSTGDAVNPPTVATGWRGYSIVDLGRISIPTGIDGATQAYSIGMDTTNIFANTLAAPGTTKSWGSSNQCTNNGPWDVEISQLYIVPEDSTQYFLDSPRRPLLSITFVDATPLTTSNIGAFTDDYGNAWTSTSMKMFTDGAGATMSPATANAILYPPADMVETNWTVETELTGQTFNTSQASNGQFSLYRWTSLTNVVGVQVGHTGGGNYLSITGLVAQACSAFPAIAPQPLTLGGDRLLLRMKYQGESISAQLEYFNYSPTAGLATYTLMASLAASAALNSQHGRLQFSPGDHRIRWIRAHAAPSYSEVASGAFVIDSTVRTAQYVNAAGSYQRTLKNQRGAFLTTPAPSPAAVFVLRQPMDAPADQTSAVVSVRERFTFFR
jgi:hypothetical protein